jgi:hypothetical protein
MKTMPATLLVEHVQRQLGPGYYVAESGTPAYHELRAAVEAGTAQLVGERYAMVDRGLVKITTAALHHGPPVAANPSIGIGRAFFVGALKDYRDWQVKWWREVVQNSVDAGANEIKLDATQDEDGTWVVSCTDNGGGMTEEILITKFLVLGESTKQGQAGAAGGFGKAKELILLPWITWEVWTRDVIVRGAGADYEIHKAPSFLRGTKLTVRMPPDEYTAGHQAVAFVEKCFLPGIRFRVNGKAHRAKLNVGEKIVDSVPGKIDVYHVKKKDMSGYGILVRAKGLFMFTTGYQSMEGGQLVAEITAPSIEILTANRDGFRDGSVRRALDDLGTLIAKDVKSALRAKKGIIRQKFRSGGKFQGAKRREVEALASIHSLVPTKQGKLGSSFVQGVLDVIDTSHLVPPPPLESVDELADSPPMRRRGPPMDEKIQEEAEWELLVEALDKGFLYDVTEIRKHKGGPYAYTVEDLEDKVLSYGPAGREALVAAQRESIRIAQAASAAQAETVHSIAAPERGSSLAIMESVDILGVTHAENAIKQLVWEPDFYIVNNVEGWTPQKRFYPESMTPKLNKVARVWTELCRWVLIQLNCPHPFGVGWIFETGVGAAYQGEDPDDKYASFKRDGEHWLLLNPFTDTNPRTAGFFSPTKAKDLKVLLALAIHEATHMANGITYHDESFASALTHNMAICADGFKHARKIAASVKMHSRARADRR